MDVAGGADAAFAGAGGFCFGDAQEVRIGIGGMCGVLLDCALGIAFLQQGPACCESDGRWSGRCGRAGGEFVDGDGVIGLAGF